jgi:large conductance mechanosensitive channel
MLKDFRDFLSRGNLIELAVAFVMGVAFAAVVTSLVDNLVMPVVAMIIGKPNFDNLTLTLNDAVFQYGKFITSFITFLAIAAAVFFFVVKPTQLLEERRRRGEGPAEPTAEEARHAEVVALLERIAAK